MSNRKPFYVRCYAKPEGDQWVALCIDLTLAAQADSFEQAKFKLEQQINHYVHDALTVDREHADELLNRKAPLANRFEYHMISLVQALRPAPKCERAFEELVAVPA